MGESTRRIERRELPRQGHDRVLVLVKALPHVGERHGETVCCAGVTSDLQWRRQYPVHFRRLRDNQFSRWQWIDYDWISPGPEDKRRESRRVQEDTIKIGEIMPSRDRAKFLAPILTASTAEAVAKGMTLTLVRPQQSTFRHRPKTAKRIAEEHRAYEMAAKQSSFLDQDLIALSPCPYSFFFDWTDGDRRQHRATCDDWETAAMFYRREKTLGTIDALQDMSRVFNEDYPRRGMVFAMGTHSRRPEQWLLVGVLRLDRLDQMALAL